MKKICIVTTRHISYNPRVLKEADTFFSKGYQVSVVTINNHSHQHHFDEELMKTRSWQLQTVNFRKEQKSEKLIWFYLSFKQKIFSLLSKISFRFGIAERAALKGFDELTSLAQKENADFYLAHHAEALAVGYKAAMATNAKFGFDAEDFHTGMNESQTSSHEEKLITFLENRYLPRCNYFTAASKGIGEAYIEKYGIKQNNVVLNVFPIEKAAAMRTNTPIRFYWYSQVIGPNRSLETLLQAAGLVKEDFEIHLRGSFHNNEYEVFLLKLLDELNLNHKVFFHKPILAENIISDATKYDIGLALESDISTNRNICVTNKIFSYLMSGLAIIGTDTYGQKDIFSHFSDAVLMCRKNDIQDLGRAMSYFITHREKLLQAKLAARKAAEGRYNWEFESEKLILSFEKTLNPKLKHESVSDRN